MTEKADDLQSNPFEIELKQFHIEMHKMQKKEKMAEVLWVPLEAFSAVRTGLR